MDCEHEVVVVICFVNRTTAHPWGTIHRIANPMNPKFVCAAGLPILAQTKVLETGISGKVAVLAVVVARCIAHCARVSGIVSQCKQSHIGVVVFVMGPAVERIDVHGVRGAKRDLYAVETWSYGHSSRETTIALVIDIVRCC